MDDKTLEKIYDCSLLLARVARNLGRYAAAVRRGDERWEASCEQDYLDYMKESEEPYANILALDSLEGEGREIGFLNDMPYQVEHWLTEIWDVLPTR